MKPLADLPADEARNLRGLLFDLDDTLLSHGRLTREAYGALWDLHEAGLKLVAVTGRPAGWGEVLARQWPVEGCVTENGAVHVLREGPVAVQRDAVSVEERRARRVKLARIIDAVRTAVPELRLTDDVDARRSDVTWDVGERCKLPEDRLRLAIGAIEAHGARWSVSSVHLHATFDTDDKASGATRFLVEHCGEDSGAAVARYAFIGDSGNDAPCFNAFHTTFGVSNVRAAVARLSIPPRYIASRPMGQGFAEVARALLALR